MTPQPFRLPLTPKGTAMTKLARTLHALELTHAASLRRAAFEMALGDPDRGHFFAEARRSVSEAALIRIKGSLMLWRKRPGVNQ